MTNTIMSPYVETRNGGYYVTGTRVSLASVIYEFSRGATPETILANFPALRTLVKLYGAITFILEQPDFVEVYLKDEEEFWNEFEQKNPLPADMPARYMKGKEDLELKSA